MTSPISPKTARSAAKVIATAPGRRIPRPVIHWTTGSSASVRNTDTTRMVRVVCRRPSRPQRAMATTAPRAPKKPR